MLDNGTVTVLPPADCDIPPAPWCGSGPGRETPATLRTEMVLPAHPLRARTESLIRAVYDRTFGARDLVFADTLIAWFDEADQPVCAAGLRTAVEGFFSEIYLDSPIERVLGVRAGQAVTRESIFEVTTLVSRINRVSPAFVRHLAAFGREVGFEWSFFTATARLRTLLRRLRIPVLELAPAEPAKLVNAALWGSYYAHAPYVCAVTDRAFGMGADFASRL